MHYTMSLENIKHIVKKLMIWCILSVIV